MFVSKERIQVSPEISEKLRKTDEAIEAAKEAARNLQPECPDDSGEIGIFNQEASDALGGIMVYKTESGKYFHWVDTVKKGSVIDPMFLDRLNQE